jgi:hypothetical protein
MALLRPDVECRSTLPMGMCLKRHGMCVADACRRSDPELQPRVQAVAEQLCHALTDAAAALGSGCAALLRAQGQLRSSGPEHDQGEAARVVRRVLDAAELVAKKARGCAAASRPSGWAPRLAGQVAR